MAPTSRTGQLFLGLAAVGAVALGALVLPSKPAGAQGWVGFNAGPVGIGVATPYYGYPYYPYNPYYPYPRYFYYPPHEFYPPLY